MLCEVCVYGRGWVASCPCHMGCECPMVGYAFISENFVFQRGKGWSAIPHAHHLQHSEALLLLRKKSC